jgi:hypothetical protein
VKIISGISNVNQPVHVNCSLKIIGEQMFTVNMGGVSDTIRRKLSELKRKKQKVVEVELAINKGMIEPMVDRKIQIHILQITKVSSRTANCLLSFALLQNFRKTIISALKWALDV